MQPRRAVLLVLLLAVGGILPCRAWSATYYVSASGGNNANSCAAAQNTTTPRQTVTAGVGCLGQGDTLIVKDGTYPECLADIIPSGVSASQPTIVKAEHKRQAIMTGPGNACSDAIILIGIRGDATSAGSVRHYITLDGLFLDMPVDRPSFGVKVVGGVEDGAVNGSHDMVFQDLEVRGGINTGSVSTFSIAFNQGGNQFGWTFRGNYIHDIGMVGTMGGPAWSYGMYISGSDNLIEGNEFTRISGYGFHGYSTANHFNNNIIRNNFFHDIGGPLLFACAGHDNQIYNNIVARTGIGPAFQRGGIVLGTNCAGTPAANNQIYNNTIVGTVGGSCERGITLSCSGLVDASNNTVRNNILFGNSPDDTIANASAGAGSNVINTNLTGPNPLFAGAALSVPSDFQLTLGSPAINQGATLGLFNTDYGGITRPQPPGGAWDMGAYEFVTGGSSGVPTSGHWTFDEGGGTSALDSSGNGNTGTLIGGPTYVPGRVGPFALAFNGTTAVVTAPVANNPQYTWAHLVKATQPPSTTAVMHTLTNGNDQTEPFSFAWGHDTASFRQAAAHQAINGNYYAAQIPSPLSANVWYHIAGTYDGTTLRVYLNGVLQATRPGVPAPLAPTGSLYMGGGSRPNTNFAGSIDDVLLYQRALTDTEIFTLYQSTLGSVRHRITSQ